MWVQRPAAFVIASAASKLSYDDEMDYNLETGCFDHKVFAISHVFRDDVSYKHEDRARIAHDLKKS